MRIISGSRMDGHMAAVMAFLVIVAIIAGMVGCVDGGRGPKYDLTTASSNLGGSVTTPGEGTYTYDNGEEVDLVAEPGNGYHFVYWTGDVSTIDDVNASNTTITMDGDYSIFATFCYLFSLAIRSTSGGNVISPPGGVSDYAYPYGTVVNLEAQAGVGYTFVSWTGDVDTVADVNAARTTITIVGDTPKVVTANFVPAAK